MATPISAPTLAVTAFVTVLLVISGSLSVADTEAVLLIVPERVVVATKLTVIWEDAARDPSAQVTVEVPEQVPWLGVLETKVNPLVACRSSTRS